MVFYMIAIKTPRLTPSLLGSERASRGVREPRPESPGFSHGEVQLREAEAEAKKKIAKARGQAQCQMLKAKAEADSNKMVSESVTTDLIQWQAVQKWDGKMPKVTSGALPFIECNEI